MMDLDPKTTDVFAGKVVRKDLVRKVKVGANVPVYVLEYLIGKYCATDDPVAIEAGLRMVNRTIAQNFIRPDEANKAQFQLKDRRTATFIDKVRVRALEDKDWAEMANFGNKYLHVPDYLIRKYPRILELGVWAQVDLEYRPLDDEEHGGKGRPFYITDIRPIQLASFDFEQYVEGRTRFTTEEWTDLIIRSVGLEPSYYDRRLKLLFLTRLVPMAERNYNLVEALRASRRQNYSGVIEEEFAFGEHLNARDERAVRKTVSGLLKILHPHGEWTRAELREYLELALEGRRRIKEQLKKLAPHEYARTAFSYIERDTGMEFWVEAPEQPDNAVAETISNEGADTPVQARAAGSKRLSVEKLMSRGESSIVEFKSSARWNLHKGDRDQAIEREIVKAVSGFMNAQGGALLIGVNDSHEAIGLRNDYKLTKKGNRAPRDSFENWLTDLFDNSIGRPALANMTITFEEVDGHDVCRIEVKPSRKPVYAQGKQTKDFYVRLNNGARSLDIEDALNYITAHNWNQQ